MIKVIIGFKVKKGEDIQPVLFKLRSHAMTFAGYIGAENLVGETDRSVVAMIASWERIENWKEWEKSVIGRAAMREAAPALEEEPRITIFRPMPTSGWGYAPRGS